jgi:hypothetical protein
MRETGRSLPWSRRCLLESGDYARSMKGLVKAWLALGRKGEGEVCWEKVVVSGTRELSEGRPRKVKDRVFICLLRRLHLAIISYMAVFCPSL